VAGVGGGEAPAWIAANLGVALAGRCSTLLVDARLGSRFGRPGPGEPDTAGLHEVLLGSALDDAVSPGPVRGLSVLPSGGWGLEPPPGLVAERFAAVADGARARFRGVVVIAPPLDSSDDGRLMASGAGLLLVVPEHRFVAGELRAHADRVRAAGGRLVGVVLVAEPLVAA
jgi:MinD-like ATPase involved in chromosome partitioning or flagellar assembly